MGFELRIAQADDGIARVAQKQELVALDARRAEDEIAGLDLRQADARASVSRLAEDQRSVDERLASAQRRYSQAIVRAAQAAAKMSLLTSGGYPGGTGGSR